MDTNYPWISVETNIMTCPDGHRVRLHAYSMSPELAPQIVVLGELLSAAECDEIVALSRHRLETATVADAVHRHNSLDPSDTAEHASVHRDESPVIAKIDARIAALTQWSIDDADDMQITRYREGGVFKPRHDGSHPDALTSNGGQTPRRRVATVIIYLNDCPTSGAVSFPRTGLSVCPHKGNALFFNYPQISKSVADDRCLHGGLPIPAGEKWIATKWLTHR